MYEGVYMLGFSGWTTIYVFSSTDLSETSVLSRLIVWACPKLNKNEIDSIGVVQN